MPARLQRPQLIAAAVVILTLNAQAAPILAALASGIPQALFSLLGINAIVWLALIAALAIAGEQRAAEPASGTDLVLFACALVAAFIPVKALSGFALVLLSAWWCWQASPGSRSRGIALIGLALTGRVFWGKLLLTVFGGTIASLEARIVPILTGLQVQDNVMLARDGVTTFVVAASCSSVANLSLVLILGVTAMQLFRIERPRPLWLAMAGALGLVVALNTARLALFGFWPQHHVFLHDGFGASLFGYALLIVIGLCIMGGIARATPRRI